MEIKILQLIILQILIITILWGFTENAQEVMTVADQIKILDKKYAKWSTLWFRQKSKYIANALYSNNFDIYKYLTGEDLGLKPSTVKQARFEYSPLSKLLNKCLKEEQKKEGPLKILKKILKARMNSS